MHTRVVDRNTAHRKIAQFLGYFHLVHEHNQGESCMLLVAPNILGLRFILADRVICWKFQNSILMVHYVSLFLSCFNNENVLKIGRACYCQLKYANHEILKFYLMCCMDHALDGDWRPLANTTE